MNYLITYMYQCGNYKIQNKNNIYNFIIDILEIIPLEEHEKVFKLMKKNIGLTYYDDFLSYSRRKGYKYE